MTAAVSLDLLVSRPRSATLSRRPPRSSHETAVRATGHGLACQVARAHATRTRTRSRAAPPRSTNRRRAEACRRPALTRGGRAAKRRPKPHLTTPQLGARAAETTREPEPSHALERFGEPERSAEMTAGAALVARHLRVDEQPAEVAAVSRSPLHGGDHGGLRPRRANPTRHETPPLPRVCVGQLVANDLPSGATHAAPASTAQHLERLQAAGSSPQ